MNLDLKEDIHSITELKTKTKELLAHAKKTKRPLVLTTSGKVEAVILDVEVYQQWSHVQQLAELLAEAEQDFAAKRTITPEQLIKNLRKHIDRHEV